MILRAYSGTLLDNFLAGYCPASSTYDKSKIHKSAHREVYVCLRPPNVAGDDLAGIFPASLWTASHFLRPYNELIVLSGLVCLEDLALDRLGDVGIEETDTALLISALGENAHLRGPRFRIARAYTFEQGGIRKIEDLPEFYLTLMQSKAVGSK